MTDHDIASLLFAADAPAPADLTIVFGAEDDEELRARTEHAIDLYHIGYVPLLLFAGRGKGRSRASESSRMEAIALSSGVPASALILENGSMDTVENVVFSLDVLRGRGLFEGISSALLVSSPWHMGRVLKTARSHTPSNWELRCCPPPAICDEQNWRSSPAQRERVLHELAIYRSLASREEP
jgi:uncharacterized SAM-binding protein YcdF (DUF218 family)